MTRPMKCNQEGCTKPALYRFTWPGRDEEGICEGHEPKLRHIAMAMGLHLQLIPLAEREAASSAARDHQEPKHVCVVLAETAEVRVGVGNWWRHWVPGVELRIELAPRDAPEVARELRALAEIVEGVGK